MKRTYFNILLALCVGTQLQAMNDQEKVLVRDIGTQTGQVGVVSKDHSAISSYEQNIKAEKKDTREFETQTDSADPVVDNQSTLIAKRSIEKKGLLSKYMRKLTSSDGLKTIAMTAGCGAVLYHYLPAILAGRMSFGRFMYDARSFIMEQAPFISSLGSLYYIYKFMNPSSTFGNSYVTHTNDISKAGSDDYGFKKIVGEVPQDIKQLAERFGGDEKTQALYDNFNVDYPKGILFYGKPGTGKTLLARAIAEQVGCPFISAEASNFVTVWQGSGPDNVNKLFATAKKAAEDNDGKAIIFIDELDSIGSRTALGGNSEARKALTALLAQMDGFTKDTSVIVIGATNDPDALDPALKRAGRFDKMIEIALPNKEKRIALLEYYTKERPIADDVSFDAIADQLEGCNAADIKELANAAASQAIEKNRSFKNYIKAIDQNNFDEAIRLYKHKRTVSSSNQVYL